MLFKLRYLCMVSTVEMNIMYFDSSEKCVYMCWQCVTSAIPLTRYNTCQHACIQVWHPISNLLSGKPPLRSLWLEPTWQHTMVLYCLVPYVRCIVDSPANLPYEHMSAHARFIKMPCHCCRVMSSQSIHAMATLDAMQTAGHNLNARCASAAIEE